MQSITQATPLYKHFSIRVIFHEMCVVQANKRLWIFRNVAKLGFVDKFKYEISWKSNQEFCKFYIRTHGHTDAAKITDELLHSSREQCLPFLTGHFLTLKAQWLTSRSIWRNITKNSTFYPHSVLYVFLHVSLNKQLLLPYTILNDWSS